MVWYFDIPSLYWQQAGYPLVLFFVQFHPFIYLLFCLFSLV